MSYSKLKQKSDINDLRDKFSRLNGNKNNQTDETYWTTDHIRGSDGKGYAVIRFLPAPPDGEGGIEPDPIVKWTEYSFRGSNGKWYINRSRASLGSNEPDPAHQYNGEIWQDKSLTKDEKKKKLLQRNIFYVAGIQVLKDPNKPENEGKVFRYKFGPMIYNMIQAQLFPEFETDKPVNVFDPVQGASFELRVITKRIPDRNTGELREVPSYEESKFHSPSPLCSPEEFDAIWEMQHSLQSEIAENKFKSYEQLVEEFNRAMGNNGKKNDDDDDRPSTPPKSSKTSRQKSFKEDVDDDIPDFDEPKSSNKKSDDDTPPWEEEEETTSKSSSVDEDLDDWFADLK